MVGRSLGHYEIVEPLGSGGMGDVYRAHDAHLHRDVAIKVLSEDLADDPDLVARLRREAHLLAALNHPNVATIHGFEESEGRRFLVMELVEGESLEQCLAAGRLGVGKALDICRQIAEALEVTHEKGIVHRDLKPSNVMVTPRGRVKILDFGVAKALRPAGVRRDLRETAESTELTSAGTIVGTAPYMSPEQVRGAPCDRRVDVWSFGCVLYETLTSRKAFGRETIADTLAAIIERDPNWEELPPSTPPAVRALLRRCLQKDPERRMRDMGDARIEIEEALREPDEALREPGGKLPGAATETSSVASRGRAIPWSASAAIIVLGAAAAAVAIWQLMPRATPERLPLRSLEITLPANEPLALAQAAPLGIGQPSMALSPDGADLVYVVDDDGVTQLYLRPLAELEATPMPGTEGGFAPFFSPDGNRVGFFTESQLKIVPVRGGAPLVLCEARNPYGASWAADETIIWADAEGASLIRVAARAGARPEVIDDEGLRWWPQVLPDGRAVLYTGYAGVNNPARQSIGVFFPESGERRTILEGGAFARYVPSGHLVFGRSGTLVAVPFDIDRLETTGDEVTVLEGVRTEAMPGAAQVAFSADGSLVYLPGGDASMTRPVWVDREGAVEALPVDARIFGAFRLSPDGDRLAIAQTAATSSIWVYELGEALWSRVTTGQHSLYPVWTSDGEHVVYHTRDGADQAIYRKRADGGGDPELLIEGPHIPLSWSPVAPVLVYTAPSGSSPGHDIWVASFENGTEPQPLVATEFVEGLAALSPDGRWIAYFSDEPGESEVFVRPFPGTEDSERYLVSRGGGEEPRWSPRGNELFYRNGNRWMAVEITTDPEFSAGTPELVFEGGFANVPGSSYDVSPDGRRFLVLAEAEPATYTSIRVLLNWFEELKERAPISGR